MSAVRGGGGLHQRPYHRTDADHRYGGSAGDRSLARSLIYHERLGVTVLVNGGLESGQPAEAPLELWSWDGTSWRLLSRDGPSWRNFASVVYDSDRGVLIVHGGLQRNGTHLDETWEWDGQRWQCFDAGTGGPGGREGERASPMTRSQVTVLAAAATAMRSSSDPGCGTARLATAGCSGIARAIRVVMEFDPLPARPGLYGGDSVSGGPIAAPPIRPGTVRHGGPPARTPRPGRGSTPR